MLILVFIFSKLLCWISTGVVFSCLSTFSRLCQYLWASSKTKAQWVEKVQNWKYVFHAFITIHNVSRGFSFLTPPFLNPGKTDSTTGLWVQQTQSSKRKPQTQQAKVSTIIEQSDSFASQWYLSQKSCLSKRSQSCGLQQDLHHKNTLLLPPCLSRILRWSNRTIVSLQQRQQMLRFKDQTSLSCPEPNTSQLSFKQG